MSKYNNGKIYEIINKLNPHKFYIGSTIRPLPVRLYRHRKDSLRNSHKGIKLYNKMNKYGVNNFAINLLEKYPCSTLKELRKRENDWISMYKPIYNTRRAYRSKQILIEQQKKAKLKYYKIHKDEVKDRAAEYYIQNKNKILVRRSQKIDCECGKALTQGNFTRHKNSKNHIDWIEANK